MVAPPAEVFERGAQMWKHMLVGQFLGASPSFSEIKRMVDTQWRKFGPVKISSTDKRVTFFRFNSEDNCSSVLDRIWYLFDKPLILKRWVPGMNLEAYRTEEFPMWVRLMNVLANLWKLEGLGFVASAVGTPL